MFENLIAQPSAGTLISDIKANRLPPSILFSGPAYSGKLTAALELARILSCEEGTGDWVCTCASCLKHRELNSVDTLIMGARSCVLEIKAAASAFLSTDSPGIASRYLFIRSVRKLTLRFHPVFADADDGRFSKASPLLASLNDALEEISPSYPLPEREALEKLTDSIVDAAVKLEDNFLYSAVPVSYVRNVSSWLRVKPAGKVKVLIVENVETMQDASRNAFLKILEEPPENVRFVLTAVKRGAVIPTILSRVRNYPFVQRSPSSEEEIIRRVFKTIPEPGESLSAFMDKFLPVNPAESLLCARRFLFSVLRNSGESQNPGRRNMIFPSLDPVVSAGESLQEISVQEISSLMNKFKPDAVWKMFLSCIMDLIRKALREPSLTPLETELCRKWIAAIRKAYDATSVFNLTPAASLSRLEYELRSCLK